MVQLARTAKAMATWGLAAWLPSAAWAQSADPHRWQLNMGRGVTPTSHAAYDAHMWVLWVCVAIGLIVFGAMAVAIVRFRKSKGAVASQFSHNTTAEVVWTIIPVVILVVLAFPATRNLIKMYDSRNAEMTVKVTGYQWLWKYEYLGQGVSLTSRLDRKSEQVRQSKADARTANHPHYLLDVDNALALPTNTKIRFVITADDVIHAWWVPALGWKQDAIPGFVNEAWAEIEKPGIYRGQCAELCGKDHGFMPIVVRAVPKAEYDAWLTQQRGGAPAAPAPEFAAPRAPAPEASEASEAGPSTPPADGGSKPLGGTDPATPAKAG